MEVEVFFDVVCPWCYLGERRLEGAIEDFDGPVEVVWRAFQLEPDAPRSRPPEDGGQRADPLREPGYSDAQVEAARGQLTAQGAAEGIEYALDRAHRVNTFDAHRLVKVAARQGRAAAMVERLFRAQLTEGLRVDDPAVLADLAATVGVPTPDADRAAAEADAAAVVADLEAARSLGVTGVPFFVFDREFAISGAQPRELFARALAQAAKLRESSPNSSS